MKKVGLIMLLVLFLSVSMTVTAENLDGFTNSQETILTFPVVEIQAVTAPDFGGVAVLSVCLSKQVVIIYTTVGVSADIGLEMENIIESDNKILIVTNIERSRGGYLHFASHYKQGIFT
jgi:hypothetical protein